MIIVFKLISGEEIIGRLDIETDEQFAVLEQYELFDPMWIVPTEGGSMKLRDALMLSENTSLIFIPECIITCYKPSTPLTNYYKRASEYSINFTRESIDTQIEMATQDLVQEMADEKEQTAKAAELLRNITGSKLH
jgi:hypothetical protein